MIHYDLIQILKKLKVGNEKLLELVELNGILPKML
jgi:hypothetical protein